MIFYFHTTWGKLFTVSQANEQYTFPKPFPLPFWSFAGVDRYKPCALVNKQMTQLRVFLQNKLTFTVNI